MANIAAIPGSIHVEQKNVFSVSTWKMFAYFFIKLFKSGEDIQKDFQP